MTYATKSAISKILIMHCDVMSYVTCTSNKDEYLEKEEKNRITKLYIIILSYCCNGINK